MMRSSLRSLRDVLTIIMAGKKIVLSKEIELIFRWGAVG